MHQIAIISLMVAGMAIVVERMKIRLPHRRFKRFVWLTFAVYIAGNLYFTLLSRVPGSEAAMDFRPFRAHTGLPALGGTDTGDATGFAAKFLENTTAFTGIFLNILLYCPMGYLIPVIFPKLKPWQIILIGCLCSIATEAAQYFLKMGLCETDDVIDNTLGAALGLWVWRLQAKRLDKRIQ